MPWLDTKVLPLQHMLCMKTLHPPTLWEGNRSFMLIRSIES